MNVRIRDQPLLDELAGGGTRLMDSPTVDRSGGRVYPRLLEHALSGGVAPQHLDKFAANGRNLRNNVDEAERRDLGQCRVDAFPCNELPDLLHKFF